MLLSLARLLDLLRVLMPDSPVLSLDFQALLAPTRALDAAWASCRAASATYRSLRGVACDGFRSTGHRTARPDCLSLMRLLCGSCGWQVLMWPEQQGKCL